MKRIMALSSQLERVVMMTAKPAREDELRETTCIKKSRAGDKWAIAACHYAFLPDALTGFLGTGEHVTSSGRST